MERYYMIALITGASSGIGRDIAKYLSEKGYDLILVSRDEAKLKEVAKSVKTKTRVIVMDLSNTDNCKSLHQMVKKDKIDILVNNAGFGAFGKFNDIELDKELNMINLNIRAVHVLTKLFLREMKKRDYGYILNVASSAAFLPGPLMSTYYATKAYVLRLTEAIYEELKEDNSDVVVSCLCPGPVKTNFNKVANVEFDLKSLTSEYVSKYAIDMMLKKKLIIIPGIHIKLGYIFSRIVPTKILLKVAYKIQRKKTK
jgi:short-subunit dehydrogenase